MDFPIDAHPPDWLRSASVPVTFVRLDSIAQAEIGDDHFLVLEILRRANVGAGDDPIVPVVLRLRQVGHALVATRAVVIGLVVKSTEEIVGAVQKPWSARVHRDEVTPRDLHVCGVQL